MQLKRPADDELLSMSNTTDHDPTLFSATQAAHDPEHYQHQPAPPAAADTLNNNAGPVKKVKVEAAATDNMTTTAGSSPTNVNGNAAVAATGNNGTSSPTQSNEQTPSDVPVVNGQPPAGAGGGSGGGGGHGPPAGPSKVVHIRNIPNEANESDLINLGLPFGKINNIMLLKGNHDSHCAYVTKQLLRFSRPGKNQAFVEFADIASAQCMVSYWVMNSVHTQPTVRGRHVFCQFSNHQQLKQNHNHNLSAAGGGNHHAHNGHVHNGTNGHASPAGGVPAETPVVRVVVDQLLYPMTLDTFYQLFSRYGKVSAIAYLWRPLTDLPLHNE